MTITISPGNIKPDSIFNPEFLSRKISVKIGVVTIPITPFTLRNGMHLEHIFGFYTEIRLGDEYSGFGYTHHLNLEGANAAFSTAKKLLASIPATMSQLLAIEEIEQNTQPPGNPASKSAANAISLAAWDLTGHYCDKPCAELWGGNITPQPCYDSYTLAFAADHQLADAARQCRETGYQQAKMIVGMHSVEEDLARVETVLEVFGPHNLAVDALCSWTPDQANEFMTRISQPLLWVEDPVPYSDCNRLLPQQTIAAGERSNSVSELLTLAESGVSAMLIDLGLIGGPMRQLQASRILAGIGVNIGYHAYPYYSAHIAACVKNPLPVELQNWGDALFSQRPAVSGKGKLDIQQPGFGLIPDFDSVSENSLQMEQITR